LLCLSLSSELIYTEERLKERLSGAVHDPRSEGGAARSAGRGTWEAFKRMRAGPRSQPSGGAWEWHMGMAPRGLFRARWRGSEGLVMH
jgi:hypothetical protein